jgi:DNA-binding transcriptional MocR family regulator
MSIQYRTATELAGGIEADVQRGLRQPGSRLPTVRALAAEQGLAAGTVAAAYRMLRERGIVSTDGRRGTVVRVRPPAGARTAARGDVPAGVRDLSIGGPDPALLPPLPALVPPRRGYGSAAIDPRLAALARSRLAADGITGGTVTVVGGALDGIERLLTSAAAPGDRVAVEDPGWGNVLDLIAALGLVAEPVGVDDDGPRPADVARAVRAGARAVIVTSRAQNPTGAALTPARAAAVADAAGPGVLLIDDDHAADVAGAPAAGLCAGRAGAWALVRSVSKAYDPDLRLAILAADPATADRVEGRQRLGTGWVSGILQNLVVSLWSDPAVDAVVAAAAGAYARRRDALITALAGHGVAAHGRSGMNVWVPLTDEAGTVARLHAAGWAVAPGARYRQRAGPGIRITVAALNPDEAPALAAAVAAAVRPGHRVTLGT